MLGLIDLTFSFLQTIDDDRLQKAIFTELLSWTEDGVSKIVGGEANRLVIYILTISFISFYPFSDFFLSPPA